MQTKIKHTRFFVITTKMTSKSFCLGLGIGLIQNAFEPGKSLTFGIELGQLKLYISRKEVI